MKGYKTYISAVVVGIAAAMKSLGYDEMSEAVLMFGMAGGLAGMRAAMK